MNSIKRMKSIRDVVRSIPDRLNPLLAPDHSLTHPSGVVVFAFDGFGYYPRINDWESVDIERRIAAFRSAISKVSNDWIEFLSWWEELAGQEGIAKKLKGNLGALRDLELYEDLLLVMVNTPASWGDHHCWKMLQSKNAGLIPFVTKWERDKAEDPWHLAADYNESGKLMELGQAEVTSGLLPEKVEQLSPIFWNYLYPLCRRTKYDPPRDPAKYDVGRFFQIVLPVKAKQGNKPIGWATVHIQSNSEHLRLLQAFSDPNHEIASAWNEVESAIHSS